MNSPVISKKYVFHLGMSDFPSSNATSQRIKLTLKGLKILGFYPLIINKQSLNSKKYNSVNRLDGIPFLFTSFLPFRSTSFIIRNINKITGLAGETIFLIKKRKKLSTAILYTASFLELVYYRLLSKMLGFKIIIQYVEMRSSIPERNKLSNKVNDILFDRYFYFFCDGVIAISNLLVSHVIAKAKKKPLIKLPAICDFSQFSSIQAQEAEPYLMYCGTIVYDEVIDFIIDIFNDLKSNKKYAGNLVLVISGNHESNWKKIKSKIIGLKCCGNIILKSSIPYNELLSLYKGADLLMIPIRNTLQDNARFPHKIGEYTASQRPILSTNSGEIKSYFKDGVSAILVDDYSYSKYVAKLSSALSSKADLDKIGKEGYNVGMQSFDYHAQTVALKDFILKL